MKLILFLAAIYSLIIHQSRKNTWVTELPGEQKTMTEKLINPQPHPTFKTQPQPFILPGDSIRALGLGGSIYKGIHTIQNEKDQQYISLLTKPFFKSRQ